MFDTFQARAATRTSAKNNCRKRSNKPELSIITCPSLVVGDAPNLTHRILHGATRPFEATRIICKQRRLRMESHGCLIWQQRSVSSSCAPKRSGGDVIVA